MQLEGMRGRPALPMGGQLPGGPPGQPQTAEPSTGTGQYL
jgi:hypothetical protein